MPLLLGTNSSCLCGCVRELEELGNPAVREEALLWLRMGRGVLNKTWKPPQSQAQPPSGLLTKYFLNILSRPPWPRAGCPCLPLPLPGQGTKAKRQEGIG